MTPEHRNVIEKRILEAEEAWLFHEATDDTVAGHGFHMSQFLYRMPKDEQTEDMAHSVLNMLADLRTLLSGLSDAWEQGYKTGASSYSDGTEPNPYAKG